MIRRLPLRLYRQAEIDAYIKAEANFRICPKLTTLRLKVILTPSRTQMREIFRVLMGSRLHPRACGYCTEWLEIYGRLQKTRPDSRFFAVIILPQTLLSMEVIAHEAVHAAHRFSERVRHAKWPGKPEEKIAYPAGYITAAIADWLLNEGIKI